MPSFQTKFATALQSSDEITVRLPGDPEPYRVQCEFDVTDGLPDGGTVFIPVLLSLENNAEDLQCENSDVTVNDGVIRISDRKGRPLILLLQAKRPLGQQDLVVKNA